MRVYLPLVLVVIGLVALLIVGWEEAPDPSM